MASPTRSLSRIGVLAKEAGPATQAVEDRVRSWANGIGAEVVPEPEGGFKAGDGLDLLITLGGDGTLLRGARQVAPLDVPVMGVNLGRLGFLTSVGEADLDEALAHLAAGRYRLDRRFMLEGRVVGDHPTEAFFAINDFVVHKAGVARVTRLSVDVTTQPGESDQVASFVGDGVIVATPTGSTAYSLSAGGPVVVPSVECIVVTPIAPHSLAVRPLAIPTNAVLRIRSVDRAADLVLTVDGQQVHKLLPEDVVELRRAQEETQVIRFPGSTFFDTLRRKLAWALDGSDRG